MLFVLLVALVSFLLVRRGILRVSFDSKMGYASCSLFNVRLLTVWGFHGNCYGESTVFRLDWFGLRRKGAKFKLEFNRHHRTTDLYVYGLFRYGWNSEHLAVKYGKHVEGSPGVPDHYVFNHRVIGQHILI